MNPQERMYREVAHLSAWHHLVYDLLARNRPHQALRLLPVILRHFPSYLHAYMQTLQALWLTRRWHEGREWALRLLRADPTQELAWAVLANAAEDEGKPAQALRYWILAFEQAPYNRPIRAGVVRTSLGQTPPLALNRPALASLYRQGRRWQKAISLYNNLVASEPKRPDFQLGLLESLWKAGKSEAALALAHSLVQQEPGLILGWLVTAQLGDTDDRVLAQTPLASLDADGIYARVRFGVRTVHSISPSMIITAAETALFQEIRQRFVTD